MDLRQYYQELRDIEREITGKDAVIVSMVTGDGGKAGLKTEVARYAAARLICDKKARLATPEESAAYQEDLQKAHVIAQGELFAQRVQVVIADSDLKALKDSRKGKH